MTRKTTRKRTTKTKAARKRATKSNAAKQAAELLADAKKQADKIPVQPPPPSSPQPPAGSEPQMVCMLPIPVRDAIVAQLRKELSMEKGEGIVNTLRNLQVVPFYTTAEGDQE